MAQITWTIMTIKPIEMESSESSYSCWCWLLKGMKIEINLLTSEDNPSRADAQKQNKTKITPKKNYVSIRNCKVKTNTHTHRSIPNVI